jgi:hypothetical protein
LGYRRRSRSAFQPLFSENTCRNGASTLELADEQREWVRHCEALSSYVDDLGIVCILPVRDEAAVSERLLNLPAAEFLKKRGSFPVSLSAVTSPTDGCFGKFEVYEV